MKTTKLTLANMQGKLSRTEMKNIMAGSGVCGQYQGQTTFTCGTRFYAGICYVDTCYCNGTPVPGGCGVAVPGSC